MTVLRGENDNEGRRDQDRRKQWQNGVVAIWVIALLVGAYWLMDAFIKNSREQECLARGGLSCMKVEIPVPPR